MKYQLTHKTYRSHLQKPDIADSEKIVIENIVLGKNKHGQWLVKFVTKNHKYLKVQVDSCASGYEDEDFEFGMARIISIDTEETWILKCDDGSKWEWPVDSVDLYLIPESKEDGDSLRGIGAVLPSKWEYQICLIPYSDFDFYASEFPQ